VSPPVRLNVVPVNARPRSGRREHGRVGELIVGARDFRHATYAIEGAVFSRR